MLLELIIIIGTIAVISAKNPVHSILFLILVFLNTAMVLISLGIDFLGIFLIIVYVGAIAILFLFVVMMLNIRQIDESTYRYLPIGFFFGVLFLFVFSLFASSGYDLLSDKINSSINWTNELKIKGNNLVQLGILLYTIYLPYLMSAAIILLVAMLGVIILTFTKSKENLYQTVYQQNSSYLNNNLFS